MNVDSIKSALLVIGVLLCLSTTAFATGLGGDITEVRAPKSLEAKPPDASYPTENEQLLAVTRQLGLGDPPEWNDAMYYGRALNLIRNAFAVRINSESRGYKSGPTRRGKIDPEFSVSKGDRLVHCLDEACEMTDGQVSWSLIHGQICMIPDRSEGEVLNVLDERISFEIQNASTWEALAALFWRLNEIDGRLPTEISFPGLDTLALPSPEFGNDDSISVSSENSTVREVLCEVFMDSPLGLRYIHSAHGNRESIMVFLHKEGLESAFTLPSRDQISEAEEWVDRLRELNRHVLNRIEAQSESPGPRS